MSPRLPLHSTAKVLALQSSFACTLSGRQGAFGREEKGRLSVDCLIVLRFKRKSNPKSRCHVPETKVRLSDLLLLHVALEATTKAEYCFAQSTFNEQVVLLVPQETKWPWVPVNVTV